MTSPSALKDKFFEKVINPYLAEVLQHPQTIEMCEGVLNIHDVEGPRHTGSMETKLEAVDQEVFKCQGMGCCTSRILKGPRSRETRRLGSGTWSKNSSIARGWCIID